jgi:dihydrofolate reductase
MTLSITGGARSTRSRRKTMRRIIAFDRVSADGYFSASDGNLNWVVPDEEIDGEGASNLSDSGTILFGRRTYEMFESFWPHALEQPGGAPDPHSPVRKSAAIQAMAVWINNATKILFSKTRKAVTWKNSRLIREFDPREVEAMKKEPGADILIFGSGSIVSLLTQHGLIDEYQLIVGPVLLGSGKQLISGVPNTKRLDLKEAKPYKSGNVRLRYTLNE